MQDEPTAAAREGKPATDAAGVEDLDEADHDVQCLVLNVVARDDQRPWSIEEIARILSGSAGRIAVEDAINQLRDVGLLNQADRLVFASQASAHIDRLGMLVL